MKIRASLLITGLAALALTGCTDQRSPTRPLARSSATPRAATVQNPVVSGPIPATAVPGDPSHDYPYFSAAPDLAKYGYLEEEFFFEGSANRYSLPALATGSVLDGGHPYRTRMVVRRPADPSDFNGILLMESELAAHGGGLDALWVASHDHIMRRGYAYISVTTQSLSIEASGTGLRAWNPDRYGTLDVSQDGTFTANELAYDIFSQAAQAVRHPQGVDPLGGLHFTHLIAIGVAGTAFQLTSYYNSVQPLTHEFDAFFLSLGGGLLRTDLDVPAFKVLTETDVVHPLAPQALLRQPASDHFRRWEVAGAASFGSDVLQEVARLRARDRDPIPEPSCDKPAPSQVPFHYALDAALDRMVDWVKRGVPPPTAPDIQVDPGPPLVVVRDADGNAVGGIRLSELAVPVATNTGVNTPLADLWCPIVGTHIPFSQERLEALYPNHQAYLSRVIEATHAAQRAGYVVGQDAAETISTAARSDIGRY